MFPLHHIIHSILYICAELHFYKVFSQTFYHLVLSTAWEEKQCRNSTGEQPKILVSFPAWNHPTRDCSCILTPSTRTAPLQLTGMSPQGCAAHRTSANQTCAFISSRICTCQVTFKQWGAWGRWDTYQPILSAASLLFRASRNGGGSSHPKSPCTPLLGTRQWSWMVDLYHVPSSQHSAV